jgi:VanZ family protein
LADQPTSGDPIDESPGGVVAPAARVDPHTRRLLWWLVAPVLSVHLLALYWPGTPGVPEPLYVDKVVHAALFAIPVWLLGRLTKRIWLVAAIFAAQAVASEVIQARFVPYRDGDVFDATADLVGIGVAVWWLLRTREEG